MNEDFEIENEGGISALSFFLGLGAGLALGVIGTVIYATYSEEQFVKVTRKTRQIGDQAQEKAGQLKDKVSDAAMAAKNKIGQVSDAVQDKVTSLKNGSKEIAGKA